MLTYGFVHVEWNHIIVNMLILIWVGVWVERLIGSARFTVLVHATVACLGVRAALPAFDPPGAIVAGQKGSEGVRRR